MSALRRSLALLPALGGCKSRPATALVLAVSAEPPAPAEIDQLQLRVTRAGNPSFDSTYTLPTDTRAGAFRPGAGLLPQPALPHRAHAGALRVSFTRETS